MTASVIDLSSRAKIIDVREQRRLATPLRFEYRTDGATPQVVLEGYAATFSPYDVYGGPAAGGWVETIHSRAFDKTLGTVPDVQLLLNHEGLPLARTKSGTLHLQADSHGLLVRASLDPTDPDVQRLMPKMRRGDMDEMSFAFRVRDQEWDSSYTNRTITEINLQKGDVSVVNYGMNPNTAAMLSSEAVSALAQLSADDLMELRKMDREQVRRAMAVLRAAETRATKPKKYADVSNFADPGYLDSAGKPAKGGNGVKRYPLNSAARVRNAAARFAQNKGRYSSAQQSAIMGKIKSAAKKFGIEISDESKAATTLTNVDHIDMQPNAAGGTTLVAVLEDGSRVPLPATSRGSAFKGAPYVWQPDKYPIDPHDEDYDKEAHAMDDDERGDLPAGHHVGDDCPGGHMDDERQDDDEEMSRQGGNFGGKKAEPFGSDDDDDDDEGRADFPDAGDEMGDYEGTDAQGVVDGYDEGAGEHETELGLDLGLASALESTIVACYKLAAGNDELRKLLSRARRQIGELQGDSAPAGDVSAKLSELRALTGEPDDKFTVTEGLRALREAGFADTMQPQAS